MHSTTDDNVSDQGTSTSDGLQQDLSSQDVSPQDHTTPDLALNSFNQNRTDSNSSNRNNAAIKNAITNGSTIENSEIENSAVEGSAIKSPSGYSGSVYGGLGHLLLTYCHAKQLAISDQLARVQNLERFDYQIWRELLTEIDQQLQQPALGLDVAEYVQLKHLGILGYLAQSCINLGEALQRYHDFHRLVYDGSPLIIQAENQHLVIRWDVPEVFTTQVTNEIAIALMYQFLKHFLHIDDIELSEVHFLHAAPKNVSAYEQYFHCKVRFSQSFAQIKVPISLLSKPIRHADQTLQALLTQQATALLEQLPNSTHLDERLQQAILLGLQKNHYQIEDISTQLNLSVRKLQRYLQQQQTTYQQRMQAVRLILAKQYLQDPHLGLQEIAMLLGYSEQSAFQRAFKHWTGSTPQNWRKLK